MQLDGAKKVTFDIDASLTWCVEVIQTPIGAIDQHHPLCQEHSRTRGNMSLAAQLDDPFWRYENLYSVKKEGSGGAIPFQMRPEQQYVARALHDRPQAPLYIIKSRCLGLSTRLGVLMANDS